MLKQVRERCGAEQLVNLAGHRADAASAFQTASFSLLTSRFEGHPLVLTESMAAGCLPIAYDIAYGPADIIEHGVNGFLVDAGDVDGLARQIEHVLAMPEAELTRMRMAARQRAADFSDQAIVKSWLEAFATVDRAEVSAWSARLLGVKYPPPEEDTKTRLKCTIRVDGLSAKAIEIEPLAFSIVWRGRTGTTYVRSEVDQVQLISPSTCRVTATLPSPNMLWVTDEMLDIDVEVRVGVTSQRLRLTAPKRFPRHKSAEADSAPRVLNRTKYGNASMLVKSLGGEEEYRST